MNFISKTEAEILLDMKRKDPEGKYEIVKLMEAFDFNRNYCMIFEKLGLSLYELLKKNDYRGNAIVYPLKSYLIHIRVFYRSYTILPENILLVSDDYHIVDYKYIREVYIIYNLYNLRYNI